MDDDLKKDLVKNEGQINVDERPPPYRLDGQYPAPSFGQQEFPATITQQPDGQFQAPSLGQQEYPARFTQQTDLGGPYPFPAVSAAGSAQTTVQHVTPPATPGQVFVQEECFAECVRFWWCRPMGWKAKSELTRARTLYMAGDYEGAQAAARCANVWSTVGLISGIILSIGVGIAAYFIVVSIV